MTEREIEKNIAQVSATMAIEGMKLTEQDKDRIRRMYRDEISCSEIVKSLVKKYSE